MTNRKVPTIRFRRKRDQLTNYRKRLGLLKSGKQRLVIRKTNKNIITQLVIYEPAGDKILQTITSQDLKKYGWNISRSNTPAMYLTGYLIAKKAENKQAILDLGLQTPKSGSKVYACLKGCIDGGLEIHSDEKVFPSEDRIKGKHIGEYAKKSENKQFSKTKKESQDIETLFEETKKKINKG